LRQRQFGNRRAHRLHDVSERVHERAVPVEHDEAEACAHRRPCSTVSSTALSSSGSGALTDSTSPFGCGSVSELACRNMRLRPSDLKRRLNSWSPYLSSPATG